MELNIVESLLQEKKITYRIQGADFVTLCLNPEHEDTNPSMRIDKIDGKFHCLSCGFKGNIFRHFGILTNHTSIRVAKLKEKLRELQEATRELDYPEGYRPITREFRGISLETLKHFEAFTCDSGDLADRVVFPMREITGKIAVFVGRHALSAGNPRYINYPRGVTLPMFPSIIKCKHLVIVEGMFDMLNLYDKGLTNVAAINGTNALTSSAKQKLNPFKMQGTTKIFILFDGDDAGREAADKLKPILEELEFTVEIVPVPDGTDPGDFSQEDVDMLKAYIE
jgi:DNA primase